MMEPFRPLIADSVALTAINNGEVRPGDFVYAGRACALAQLWEARQIASPVRNLVFVSVADGVGVGVVVNGELLRGRHNIAGEFAHMPLSIDGPRCSRGAIGCWEAHISNIATLSRYFGPTPDMIALASDDVASSE